LYAGDEVMARQVQAAGGYLSQSSNTLHFGLGDRPQVDRVEIRWPSGTRTTIQKPEINRLHRITEPRAEKKEAPGRPALHCRSRTRLAQEDLVASEYVRPLTCVEIGILSVNRIGGQPEISLQAP